MLELHPMIKYKYEVSTENNKLIEKQTIDVGFISSVVFVSKV